jgi:hypothetical protein
MCSSNGFGSRMERIFRLHTLCVMLKMGVMWKARKILEFHQKMFLHKESFHSPFSIECKQNSSVNFYRPIDWVVLKFLFHGQTAFCHFINLYVRHYRTARSQSVMRQNFSKNMNDPILSWMSFSFSIFGCFIFFIFAKAKVFIKTTQQLVWLSAIDKRKWN